MKLKGLLLVPAFAMLYISGFGQISYEGTLDRGLNAVLLDNDETKYASYHKSEKIMRVYNEDFSEWKSFPLNIPANFYFDELKSISVKVFNTDRLVELAYTCIEYRTSNNLESTTNYVDEVYTLFVVNEDGKTVMESENSKDIKIVDSNGKRKLLVFKQTGDGKDGLREQVDVYSLPESAVGNQINPFDDFRGI
ncbi:MAG: hypothetical protein R6W31_20110 [Bacteroidales bacterium]